MRMKAQTRYPQHSTLSCLKSRTHMIIYAVYTLFYIHTFIVTNQCIYSDEDDEDSDEVPAAFNSVLFSLKSLTPSAESSLSLLTSSTKVTIIASRLFFILIYQQKYKFMCIYIHIFIYINAQFLFLYLFYRFEKNHKLMMHIQACKKYFVDHFIF